MSKNRIRKQLNDRASMIRAELQSRHTKLMKDIKASREGRLDLEGLRRLHSELQKPIVISESLSIEIKDCHPSSGKYKHTMPKNYLPDFIAVEKALILVEGCEIMRSKQRELVDAFNLKPKTGIEKIKAICKKYNLSVDEQIAMFLHRQKLNLDLAAVGDYLGAQENQAVLKAFTSQINLEGRNFIHGLRFFLKTFKLPGEAQKIDRLIESFSKIYCQQNPLVGIANEGAAYILAFQIIMLNTDLHNPMIKQKMGIAELKKNLQGCNNGNNFTDSFLEEIYKDIQNNPLEYNFVKINPGYEFTAAFFSNDPIFNKLNLWLQAPHRRIQETFHHLDKTIKATVVKPKPLLSVLTGYAGTISFTDEKIGKELVTLQIYRPNLFSRFLFGENTKLVIQPLYESGKMAQQSIDLAAKIAASFQSSVNNIKATYDYVKDDLKAAYADHRKFTTELIQKEKELSKYYEPASFFTSRSHFFHATAANKQVSEIYKSLNGDELKTKILSDFKDSLKEIDSLTTFDEVVKSFENSDAYKILKKGQGIATQFFNLDTSAVKAVKEIVSFARAKTLVNEVSKDTTLHQSI